MVAITFHKSNLMNDFISVAGFEGKMIEIDLRDTTLQAEDRKILLPNYSLFTNTISVLETK
ncbi:MAG: mechanosensitive ion channel domain-containing protein [Xenococcaceae cyanobacterium]